MGRRVLNRKEMRNDFDAAERRKEDDEREDEDETEEEDDEEEDEAEGDGEEDADDSDDADDEEADDDASDDDDEDAPKKKKKKKVKAKAAAKPKAKPRSRAAKVVRMRVVWGVFSNSHQMVATYEYPKRAEADAHAARLIAEKRSTHFVQPVKEPIEEKEKDGEEQPKKKK